MARQVATAKDRKRAQSSKPGLGTPQISAMDDVKVQTRRALVCQQDALGHQLEVRLLLLRVRRKNAPKPAHISRHRRIERKQARANGEAFCGIT